MARQSASERRQAWRRKQSQRTHEQLYDASDELRELSIDASGFARMWIGVGLQIAAKHLEELANAILVEDILADDKGDAIYHGKENDRQSS